MTDQQRKLCAAVAAELDNAGYVALTDCPSYKKLTREFDETIWAAREHVKTRAVGTGKAVDRPPGKQQTRRVPDDDVNLDDDDRCECECASCAAGRCEDCSDPSCADPNCEHDPDNENEDDTDDDDEN